MKPGVLEIETIPLGPLETNAYVVRPAGQSDCWVIDPGMSPAPLLGRLRTLELRVRRVIITHGHADHIAGIGAVLAAYPEATTVGPAGDLEMYADPVRNVSAMFGFPLTAPPPQALVQHGDTLTLGTTQWRVLDTAGHTPGSVSYYCPQAAVAFVGDALFAGGIGRCDIPGASLPQLLRNIRENLLTLPADTTVFSGHGEPTTIGAESSTNPMLAGG